MLLKVLKLNLIDNLRLLKKNLLKLSKSVQKLISTIEFLNIKSQTTIKIKSLIQ